VGPRSGPDGVEKRKVSARVVEKNSVQYYSLPILRRRPLQVYLLIELFMFVNKTKYCTSGQCKIIYI